MLPVTCVTLQTVSVIASSVTASTVDAFCAATVKVARPPGKGSEGDVGRLGHGDGGRGIGHGDGGVVAGRHGITFAILAEDSDDIGLEKPGCPVTFAVKLQPYWPPLRQGRLRQGAGRTGHASVTRVRSP